MATGTGSLRYTATCVALGLALGWMPGLVHGPVPEKWNVQTVDGSIVVWGYVLARLSIGLWVGISAVPSAWYLRGPLCGALALLPLGLVGLANPHCGSPCMFWNTVTGAAVGFAVGGLAWSITGRHHAGA